MIPWTTSAPLTVGVEEEVMLLDASTLRPAAAVDVLVRESEGLGLPGVLKTELHASVVELNTRTCADVDDALAALAELRAAAAAIAERNGLRIAAAGAHPVTPPEELPVVDAERYLQMIDGIGRAARRQGVNGLHVHLGMRTADECWHALAGMLPWLPLVLALSANSPYFAGEETGHASIRATVLAELPRSGPPPPFASYGAWESWVAHLIAAGSIPDYTRLWWDVRPHPRFGTLEIRVADQPTALERTREVVALLFRLAVRALDAEPVAYDAPTLGDYVENRWAVSRYGLDAEVVVPGGDTRASARELLRGLGADVDAPEAERQLAVGRAGGLDALCLDLADRTLV